MINEEMLSKLSSEVSKRLSEKRFLHTVGVRKMAEKLAKFCLPSAVCELEAAALLHDISKELSEEAEAKILIENSVPYDPIKDKAVLHSYTAPFVVKSDFPEFSTEDILSAVKNHTLGSSDMSVFDMIIFISDYIEEGRKYDSCIKTRDFLLEKLCEGRYSENVKFLRAACVMAIDFTVKNLEERGKPVNPVTVSARNALLAEK